MSATPIEDRKAELMDALGVIADLGAKRVLDAGDRDAVELNWGAVFVGAAVQSEGDGDAAAQDKLIQAIAALLGTSDEELVTIPHLAARLAAPVVPRLPENLDLVELAGTVSQMRRVAEETLPEIEMDLALLGKLVFIHAAARAYLVEAGRLNDEEVSLGAARAEEKAQELILGEGDAPDVLLLEPDACQSLLDFFNELQKNEEGELTDDVEALLPALRAIAARGGD